MFGWSDLKVTLLPLSWLYGGVMRARNFLYDRQFFTSAMFKVPTIVVGNLTVGGTGKSPHVAYIARLLQGSYKLALVSRGYKRKTKGYRLAGTADTAATIGDEPMQFYLHFAGVNVAVSEKRPLAIEKLLQLPDPPEVILLDDAFQHRALKSSFQILITDYYRLFTRDYVLPAGLLREPGVGARRANAVIVSKCPEEMTTAEQQKMSEEISNYTNPGTPVFFTTYAYAAPQPVFKPAIFSKNIILVTGIAQPAPLVQYLQNEGFTLLEHLSFSDHHTFSLADANKIKAVFEKHQTKQPGIFTTTKDAVRLLEKPIRSVIGLLPVFSIAIEVTFLKDQEVFDALIKQAADA